MITFDDFDCEEDEGRLHLSFYNKGFYFSADILPAEAHAVAVKILGELEAIRLRDSPKEDPAEKSV